MKDKKIIIIGAGVSGITTGLVLQLSGYNTQIFAEEIYGSVDDKNAHPKFSSLFPAASVIPRSTYSQQLGKLFQQSQSLFYTLHRQGFPGLAVHNHFEIFEEPAEWPPYRDWMRAFTAVEELNSTGIPRRPEIDTIYGWRFDCLFADWPRYFPALIDLYRQSGGSIIQKKLRADDIERLPASIIANCSGAGSPALFEDSSDNQMVLRGHLLHKAGSGPVRDAKGGIISYNYTPTSDVYSDVNGKACDVYFYPRADGWVLGGSRQPGKLKDGKFQIYGTSNHGPSYTIGEVSFPAQIVDLNRDILRHSFGSQLGDLSELTASAGYRYIRNSDKSMRLEQEITGRKQIVHNYGHGGAGVTLSWGCAAEAAGMISGRQPADLTSRVAEKLKQFDFST